MWHFAGCLFYCIIGVVSVISIVGVVSGSIALLTLEASLMLASLAVLLVLLTLLMVLSRCWYRWSRIYCGVGDYVALALLLCWLFVALLALLAV